MLVRRNLLTTEEDVLVNGQWVPLQGYARKLGPMLMAQQPPHLKAIIAQMLQMGDEGPRNTRKKTG